MKIALFMTNIKNNIFYEVREKAKLEVEDNIAKKRATFETWKLSYSKFIRNHAFW